MQRMCRKARRRQSCSLDVRLLSDWPRSRSSGCSQAQFHIHFSFWRRFWGIKRKTQTLKGLKHISEDIKYAKLYQMERRAIKYIKKDIVLMSAELESALVSHIIPVEWAVNPVNVLLPSPPNTCSVSARLLQRVQRQQQLGLSIQPGPLLSSSLLLTHTVVNTTLPSPPLLSYSLSLSKSIHSHRISRR